MSKKHKLITILLSKPKDFSFNEVKSLLQYFEYYIYNKGKTSGSRTAFRNKSGDKIDMHKPHKGVALKEYQINELIFSLKERDLI